MNMPLQPQMRSNYGAHCPVCDNRDWFEALSNTPGVKELLECGRCGFMVALTGTLSAGQERENTVVSSTWGALERVNPDDELSERMAQRERERERRRDLLERVVLALIPRFSITEVPQSIYAKDLIAEAQSYAKGLIFAAQCIIDEIERSLRSDTGNATDTDTDSDTDALIAALKKTPDPNL